MITQNGKCNVLTKMYVIAGCLGVATALFASTGSAQQAPANQQRPSVKLDLMPGSLNSEAAFRVNEKGEVRVAMMGADGKPRLLDIPTFSIVYSQLATAAASLPCGDQPMPETVSVKLGALDFDIKFKAACEAGQGYAYITGSALQKKWRPNQR